MIIGEVTALIALILGSYEDIRTREIPDLISYSLIAIGLWLGAINSFFGNSFSPLLYSIAGFLAALIVSLVLYYGGLWGGGDAKLFMGLGAIIGVNFSNSAETFPLLLVFLINVLLVGAIIGIFYVIYLSIKNHKNFEIELKKIKQTKTNKALRYSFLGLVLIVIIAAFALKPDGLFGLLLIAVVFLACLLYFGSVFVKAVEQSSMIRRIKPKQLTEGDWIVNPIRIKGKLLKIPKSGITKQEINKILKSGLKEVTVRVGMPFVPSFFIAYVILLIVGNWIPALI